MQTFNVPQVLNYDYDYRVSLADTHFIYSEVRTGPMFGNIIIAWVRTTLGDFDILFDSNSELLTHPESRQLVEKLEKFYNKKFTGFTLDSVPGWAMKIN